MQWEVFTHAKASAHCECAAYCASSPDASADAHRFAASDSCAPAVAFTYEKETLCSVRLL